MRGALCRTTGARTGTRIIPADAGSTTDDDRRRFSGLDHPRGCGEHHSESPGLRCPLGSSPRMRGAQFLNPRILLRIRIIPADAGSTRTTRWEIPQCKDHPRGCGEHICRYSSVLASDGSSPRMRGAHAEETVHGAEAGIIPADAGSTRHSLHCPSGRQDHPRGCGEHLFSSVTTSNAMGSSPRMRGALTVHLLFLHISRIIPADAGSTTTYPAPDDYVEDHPRGCGEHEFARPSYGLAPGSSPRMRGALHGKRLGGFFGRIIPADAGSTTAQDEKELLGRDHPRGCGEHIFRDGLAGQSRGSSPRMRGAPRLPGKR